MFSIGPSVKTNARRWNESLFIIFHQLVWIFASSQNHSIFVSFISLSLSLFTFFPFSSFLRPFLYRTIARERYSAYRNRRWLKNDGTSHFGRDRNHDAEENLWSLRARNGGSLPMKKYRTPFYFPFSRRVGQDSPTLGNGVSKVFFQRFLFFFFLFFFFLYWFERFTLQQIGNCCSRLAVRKDERYLFNRSELFLYTLPERRSLCKKYANFLKSPCFSFLFFFSFLTSFAKGEQMERWKFLPDFSRKIDWFLKKKKNMKRGEIFYFSNVRNISRLTLYITLGKYANNFNIIQNSPLRV